MIKSSRESINCAECGVETPKRCHKTTRCPSCQFKISIKRDQKRQSANRKIAIERWKSNGNRCWWCGESLDWEAIEFDHVIPIAQGGKDKENLVPSCRQCNLKKSDGVAPTIAKGANGLEQLIGRPIELSDVFETIRA